MIKKWCCGLENAQTITEFILFTTRKKNKDVYMVALREADGTLIGYYENMSTEIKRRQSDMTFL